MRLGSLFSGVGGLDRASLEAFPGSSLAWHCETDPAASKVLAYHWPDVPNLGDVSEIDWAAVEPVDVVIGGFPCQDVSLAGRRAGIADDTRSGLWTYMAAAIAALSPQYVLIENVKGLLSARAYRPKCGGFVTVGSSDSGMESGSDAMGGRSDGHVLRAAGAVLGDLADIGYDAQWVCVRAADVGACHQRARVFILAHPADGAGSQGVQPTRRFDVPAGGGEASVMLLPTPSVTDGTGGHRSRSGNRSDELLLPGLAEACASGRLLPTPRASDGDKGGPNQRGSSGDLMLPSAVVQWGDYECAIRRQESWSRPAPEPTQPNAQGRQRLSPAFSEWMMAWPAGWVTAPEIGLSRLEQLRCIGNGVVPRQAVAAVRHLCRIREVLS